MQESFNEAAKFPLRDKSIVFTSDLKVVTKRQASAIARELGAKVTSEVSPTTDFVVAGKDGGARLQQASDQHIKVVSEEDFFAMVKEQRKNQREANGPK